MAGNPQPGAQPLRPPSMMAAAGPPQNFGQSQPIPQFRPGVPGPPGQLFMQGSPQFRPVGPGQQPQFSQPMQQLPPRPLQSGLGLPSTQPVPAPFAQAPRPVSSSAPLPQQSGQPFSSHMSHVAMPIPSPYMYGSPYGQPQTTASVPSQYQPIPLLHGAVNPVVPQPRLSSGGQSTIPVTPVVQGDRQLSTANANASGSSDWQEHTAQDGRRYYYNKKTRQSGWEKPVELMTPLERADASTVWKEFTTPDGKKYYHNKDTKESKWTIPEELRLARELAEKSAAPLLPPEAAPSSSMVSVSVSPVEPRPSFDALANGSTSTDVQHAERVSSPDLVTPIIAVASVPFASNTSPTALMGTTTFGPSFTTSPTAASAATTTSSTLMNPVVADKKGVINVLDIANGRESASADVLEEARRGMPVAGKINTSPLEEKTVDDEPLTYASKQEAKTAFKALLESANVESDWSWEQAMRVIINDKRYGALKTLGDRKQAFNEYLNHRKKQEIEERRTKQKRARDDFTKMLEESKELLSTTRWSKAVAMFEADERFNAVEKARDREDLYESYLVELHKKERARAAEDHKKNIAEYRAFLQSCDFIKVNSQWRKVQDRLEDDERCSRLEKIDRLETFQEYIRDLEKEEEERKKIQKEQVRRFERKTRDEFRKLMEDHISAGVLTAKTHWRDYCMKVKDMPAYLAVASNTSGSTPKDLFEDAAEDLEKQYHGDRAQIKDAVKNGKVVILSTWTFENFKDAISQDESFPKVSEINLKLVFDELHERIMEKEEKETKKRQRLADDFFDLLRSIKEINAVSTWEDSLPLFEESQEYRSIVDESFRKVIFHELVTHLQEKAKEKERKREEEKVKKEKEERDKKKEKERKERDRERDKGKVKERSRQEEVEDENLDLTNNHGTKEERKKGKDRKHKRRHSNVADDVNSDKGEEDDYRKSRKHSSDRKKSRKHGYTTESDSESRHKRHRRDRDGSRRHEDLEDGELGEDEEVH